MIIVPRFPHPQNSRWPIKGKVRKENTKWSFERMPRVRWGLSNDNYDSESTLKLVPTLSHIYRTRIPHTSNANQTTSGAFPIIHTQPYGVVSSFYSFPAPTKKKKLTLAFPFSSLAAFFFSDLDFFSFLPRFLPQFCRHPSNRPALRLFLYFLRGPVPIFALSIDGIRF